MNHEERLQGLEADVDARLAELWSAAWESDVVMGDSEVLALFGQGIRIAYARGYVDAHLENGRGCRGELLRAHGYRVP